MEHIILSIVCFALVLLAGMHARGENEPAEKNLSLDLLKNEINELRKQMKDGEVCFSFSCVFTCHTDLI